MKENSPICARLAEMVSAVRVEWPNTSTMTKAAIDLTTTTMSKHAQHGQWRLHQYLRIEQHADGNKEQHGEGVLQRQGFLPRLRG